MDDESHRAMLRAAAVHLRTGERLSHMSAARWYGVPLPKGTATLIHVTSPPGMSQVRHRGQVGHRDSGTASVALDGIALSTPEQTFLELARTLHADALIAAGDFLVHAPRIPEPSRPFTSLRALERACAEGRRAKGAPAARQALAHVRDGVESPMETALRLLLTRAGLPEPRCGHSVAGGGRSIGWFDLAWPDRRVLGEYDGDQHRTSTEQYEKDIWRFDAATDAGWRVIRVRAAGLRSDQRATTVARFRQALG